MNPFPNETPGYRSARQELLLAEIDLRRHTERVAARRRALPLGGQVREDYAFAGVDGPVLLSELFADGKDTLCVYSFMFLPDAQGVPLARACPSCTSIIDGLDGAIPHLTQRLNFAVSAKAPIERFAAHAETRGWRNARLLSSAESAYNRDYQAETDARAQLPVATVFLRRDGAVHHWWSSELLAAPTDPGEHPRHVDYIWPIWAAFDVTPEGRGTDWEPLLAYD
jgi:predicted dithiol-disulfide oxidoreductase (DUF899 family)